MSQSPVTPPGALAALDRFKLPVFLLLSVAILAGIALLIGRQPEPTTITIIPPAPTAVPSSTPTPGPFMVYVTGAVAQPQALVSLPAGSRVQDAIQAVGGLAPDADLDGVNLSQRLRDGDMVHVPSLLDGERGGVPTPNQPPLVWINSASVEELQTLPGIGPALAQAIVEFREQVGSYSNLEALDQVPGIGPAKLEAIREFVVFD